MSIMTSTDDPAASAAGSITSSPPPISASPKNPSRRLIGIDLARGIAILGMFAAHTLVTETANPDLPLYLVNGHSAILFAILAGVSLALLSGGMTVVSGPALRAARVRIFIRALIILGLGGVLAALGTPVAIILEQYALLFLVGIFFLCWSPRRLLILAALVTVTAPPLVLFLTFGVPTVGMANSPIVTLLVTGIYPAAIWLVFVLTGMAVGRMNLRSRAVLLKILVVGVLLTIAGYGLAAGARALSLAPPAISASSATDEAAQSSGSAPMMKSTPATKLDLTHHDCVASPQGYLCFPGDSVKPAAEADLSKFTCIDISGASQYVCSTGAMPSTDVTQLDFRRLLTTEPHSGSPLEIIESTGIALIVIALALLFARRLRFLLYPVIAMGSMVLTFYVAHLIVLATPAPDLLFAINPWLAFVVISGGSLVAATVLKLTTKRGPLEWVLAKAADRAARHNGDDTPAAGQHTT